MFSDFAHGDDECFVEIRDSAGLEKFADSEFGAEDLLPGVALGCTY